MQAKEERGGELLYERGVFMVLWLALGYCIVLKPGFCYASEQCWLKDSKASVIIVFNYIGP